MQATAAAPGCAGHLIAAPPAQRDASWSAWLAHEIRTPTTTLLGFLELLHEQAVARADHGADLELLQRLHANAERLACLAELLTQEPQAQAHGTGPGL